MKSLKIPKRKKEEEMSAVEAVNDMPDYPWGTSLHLEEEQVKKFPELKGVQVGDELTASIKVRVKRVEESASEDGGKKHTRLNVELQVTDMEFEKPAAAGADLYDNPKGETK